MFQSHLSLSVHSIDPSTALIEICGDVNLYAENQLTEAFLEAARGKGLAA